MSVLLEMRVGHMVEAAIRLGVARQPYAVQKHGLRLQWLCFSLAIQKPVVRLEPKMS